MPQVLKSGPHVQNFEYSQGILETYFAFDYQTLPPFVKTMHSFILMENTYRMDWIGALMKKLTHI